MTSSPRHPSRNATLSGFLRLLRSQPRLPLLGLALLMLVAGLTEGIGILLLAPLINLLQEGAGSDNRLIRMIEQALTGLGVPLTAEGLLLAFLGLVLLRAGLVFARDIVSHGNRRSALRLGNELSQSNRAVHGNVQETLAGLKLAKILGNERRHLDEFDKVTAALRQRQIRFAFNNGLTRSVFTVGGAAFTAGYLYLGLPLLQVPVSELFTLVVIFARLIPQWSGVQQQLLQLLHAAPALGEARQVQQRCLSARRVRHPLLAGLLAHDLGGGGRLEPDLGAIHGS